MKTVGECMDQRLLVVGPSLPVVRAVEEMERARLRCLVVLEEGRVVGLLTDRSLRLTHPNRLVADAMVRDVPSIAPEQTIWEISKLFRDRVEYLPVLQHGQLVGLLGRERVEQELARYVCPLTDLPRGEVLKHRAQELLTGGRELAIVFVDLDDFGEVNKRYGHVVGDEVLKTAAARMRTAIDPERDLLGRYGGDEFVIVTTRPLAEAERLAGLVVEALRRNGYPASIRLSASAGVAGGRRRQARPDCEPGWTVDDLFNLASLAATRAKKTGFSVTVAYESTAPAPA